MENNLKDVYIKFSNVLSGCRTLYDALFFAQFYIKNNPEYKSLINGMIHGKHYEKITDFRSIANILNILNNFETRNDIDNYINTNISKDNFDYSQINALLRLGKVKTYSQKNIVEEKSNNISILSNNVNKHITNLINNNIEIEKIEDNSCRDFNIISDIKFP